MTANQIETIELPEEWTSSGQVFDAVCEVCGTAARFETTGDRVVGEAFQQRCYRCDTGRVPGLGEPTQFRVTELDPDPDSYPGALVPDRCRQYSSNGED